MLLELLRCFVSLAGWLTAGCYLVWLPYGGLDLWPAGLCAVMAAMLAWSAWGELSLPGEPLADDHAALSADIGHAAGLAGVRLRAIWSIPGEPGQIEPGEALNRAGVVLFTTGDLAAGPHSLLLTKAARQLAVASSPPRYRPVGLLAVGAATGLTGIVRAALGENLAGALLATALVVLAAVAFGYLLVTREEARGQAIEYQARVIAGQLRDQRPEAFRDLAERQGLKPAPPS